MLERVYNFAFDKNIQLNRLKEMLWIEKLPSNHKLLFHGAKGIIERPLSVHVGRINNDFGQGFILEKHMLRRYHSFLGLKIHQFII